MKYILFEVFLCLAPIVCSACRHQFDNGSEINLMMVAAPEMNAPRFKDYPAENKSDPNRYYYNPCYDFLLSPQAKDEPCNKDVAACQASSEGYYNIGRQSTANFTFDEATQRWILSYYNPIGDRFTMVFLQCSYDMNDTLIVWGETKGSHNSVYNMTLISHCACVDGCGTPVLPHGMSVGSFLLLLLVIFIITYFSVGYLYRRLVIGARGIELLPHLSFWMDFPFLVQDGFFFLVKCGHNDTTYERI